jgi:ABC-2 type transport system permease protein
MVFNFGVTLATERAQKVDVLVRASPVPPLVYLAARTATALFFSLVALVVLFVYAYATAGIQLTLDRWLALGAALLVGSVPFIGLGFAISYLASPNAAVAIANLVVLLLAFSSGIFIQFDQLPEVVRVVAPYLPMYHFARLGWGIVGLSGESLPTSAVWLSGYAVALFALALYGYRRLERRRFH